MLYRHSEITDLEGEKKEKGRNGRSPGREGRIESAGCVTSFTVRPDSVCSVEGQCEMTEGEKQKEVDNGRSPGRKGRTQSAGYVSTKPSHPCTELPG